MSASLDLEDDELADLMASLEAQNEEVMAAAKAHEATTNTAQAPAQAPAPTPVKPAIAEDSLEDLESLSGELNQPTTTDETLLDIEAGMASIEAEHAAAEAAEMAKAKADAAAKKAAGNPYAAATRAAMAKLAAEEEEDTAGDSVSKAAAIEAEEEAKKAKLAELAKQEELAKQAKLAKDAELSKQAKLAAEAKAAEDVQAARRAAEEQAKAKAVAEAQAQAAAEAAAVVATAKEAKVIARPTEDTPAGGAGFKYGIDVSKFQQDTRITEATLDNCMMEQASVRAFYGAQAAQAEAQASRAKAKFDVVEATLYDNHRKALVASEEKVTEKMVENAVKKDVRWLKAKNMMIEAETIAALNKSMVDSLRDRKDMLVQLGADRREGMKGQLRMMQDQNDRESLSSRAVAAASAAFAGLQKAA